MINGSNAVVCNIILAIISNTSIDHNSFGRSFLSVTSQLLMTRNLHATTNNRNGDPIINANARIKFGDDQNRSIHTTTSMINGSKIREMIVVNFTSSFLLFLLSSVTGHHQATFHIREQQQFADPPLPIPAFLSPVPPAYLCHGSENRLRQAQCHAP